MYNLIVDEPKQTTILIVEDEVEIRSVYSEMLRTAGFKVLEAGDGATALNLIRLEKWDLALLDIMLPGEDGMHLLKEIKNIPELSTKPILLLTNLSNESFITECFKLGAEGYLIKSETDPGKIVSEVQSYLK